MRGYMYPSFYHFFHNAYGTEARLLDYEFTKADSFSTEARLLDYASCDT